MVKANYALSNSALAVKSPNTRTPLFLEKNIFTLGQLYIPRLHKPPFQLPDKLLTSHFRKREMAAADTSEMFHLVKVKNLY